MKSLVKVFHGQGFGNEWVGVNRARSNQVQCFFEIKRGVVKETEHLDLIVVQPVGVQLNLCTSFATTEKADSSTLSNEIKGFFPGFRQSDSFNHHIKPVAFGGVGLF